ncbi:MAG: glycosyltransferase family 2 protein [Candidatus Peribacteraceae bacterium]
MTETSRELTIIVPVYNEERTIVSVMQRLQEVCAHAEVIYVDDGSSDASLKLMQEHARQDTDQVLTKPNGGKGSAIRMGLQEAHGTYTAIQDADLEYDPKEILTLVEIAKETGQVVFGSRFLQQNPNIYKRFLLGNKVLTGVTNLLFDAKLTDSYTCFKVLRTADFRELDLEARGFELEAEITAKCLKKGWKVHEVPITYKPRTLEEGKKIGWKDAWRGIVMMLRIRFKG